MENFDRSVNRHTQHKFFRVADHSGMSAGRRLRTAGSRRCVRPRIVIRADPARIGAIRQGYGMEGTDGGSTVVENLVGLPL